MRCGARRRARASGRRARRGGANGHSSAAIHALMSSKKSRVVCLPALRVPLVHSLINQFRQKNVITPGAGNGNVSRARGLQETWKNGRVSRPVEASAPDRAWSCCTRLNGQKAVITSLAGGWPCFGEAPRPNCGIQGGREGRRLRSPRSSWGAVPEAQAAGSAADGRTDVSSPRSRRPPSRQGARGGCARRASREARAATRRPTCTRRLV